MKCQFCGRDHVDRVFYINWMGTVYQVPVCAGCLDKMWQQRQRRERRRSLKVIQAGGRESRSREGLVTVHFGACSAGTY